MPAIDFCRRGLAFGENGDPTSADGLLGLPFPAKGEFEKLAFLLAGEPLGVRAYRGGVLYWDPGVGGAGLGGRPRSLRWAGVKAMSERSSAFLNNG